MRSLIEVGHAKHRRHIHQCSRHISNLKVRILGNKALDTGFLLDSSAPNLNEMISFIFLSKHLLWNNTLAILKCLEHSACCYFCK